METQRKEIERIGNLIAGGLEGIDLVGERGSGRLFAHSEELKETLTYISKRAVRFGGEQVANEMERQK